MAPSARSTLNDRLTRFAALHAVLLLAGASGSLVLQSMVPVVAAGALSFTGFIVAFRSYWTPAGRFGAANTTTAIRLIGLLALALWPWSPETAQPLLAAGATLLLLFDGLDGWLARHTGQASAFGAFFDKEVDAFALLLLCLLAVIQQGMFVALMLAGALRYLFALSLYLGDPPAATEPRTPAARYLYVFMMTAILLPFLPLPNWTLHAVWIAVAGLLASFLPYFVWTFHGRVPLLPILRSSS